MNKIILLVGDSGSGKDFVLDVVSRYETIEVVKRFISRDPRDKEQNSISSIFSVPTSEIQRLNYYYEGVEKGNWYGINKKDLDIILQSGKPPIVICPNYENFLQIMEDYNGNVVPMFIYRGYDSSNFGDWKNSLLKRGSSTEEIENRKDKRDKYLKKLYIDHFIEYGSNVILNIYGVTTEEDIRLQFEGLCKKNNIDLLNEFRLK